MQTAQPAPMQTTREGGCTSAGHADKISCLIGFRGRGLSFHLAEILHPHALVVKIFFLIFVTIYTNLYDSCASEIFQMITTLLAKVASSVLSNTLYQLF